MDAADNDFIKSTGVVRLLFLQMRILSPDALQFVKTLRLILRMMVGKSQVGGDCQKKAMLDKSGFFSLLIND